MNNLNPHPLKPVTDEEMRWLRDDLLDPDVRVLVIERLLATEGSLDRMVQPVPAPDAEAARKRQERFGTFTAGLEEPRETPSGWRELFTVSRELFQRILGGPTGGLVLRRLGRGAGRHHGRNVMTGTLFDYLAAARRAVAGDAAAPARPYPHHDDLIVAEGATSGAEVLNYSLRLVIDQEDAKKNRQRKFVVRLTGAGAPLEGRVVHLSSPAFSDVKAVTKDDGRAEFKLVTGGEWLLSGSIPADLPDPLFRVTLA